jgi:hypothetical protein
MLKTTAKDDPYKDNQVRWVAFVAETGSERRRDEHDVPLFPGLVNSR